MTPKSGPTSAEAGASTVDRLPYLIMRIRDQQAALCTACVRQVVLMPKVMAVPHSPPEIRGVISLRNAVIPLLDLRVEFGMTSFAGETQETIQLLHDREQDHKNWIAELLNSVNNKTPFTLARDPHKCKFGKWYDTYKPENHSIAFLSLWHALDGPHCRIHALADTVCDLAAKGDFAAARNVVEAGRETELAEIVRLFGEVRTMLCETTREVAIILSQGENQLAVCADAIVAIEKLNPDSVQPLSELLNSGGVGLTPHVARRPNSDQAVVVLDSNELFKHARSRVRLAAA